MVSKKTVLEASFPSTLERAVASTLLLLSSSSPKEQSKSCSPPESHGSWKLTSAQSSGGSSSAETSPNRESYVSPVAYVPLRFNELKLKIVQKKRTKTIWVSNDKKLTPVKPKPSCGPESSECVSEITTADTLSSFSCSTSIQSCCNETNTADKLKKPVISGHMENQAKAILRVLASGSTSEVRIRQLLGDSPTTSKALRMLLKQKEVKRCGGGGRGDPYIYMMA